MKPPKEKIEVVKVGSAAMGKVKHYSTVTGIPYTRVVTEAIDLFMKTVAPKRIAMFNSQPEK